MTGFQAPIPSERPEVTERRGPSRNLYGLSTSMYNPSTERQGDPDPLSQSLDGLSTLMFNPGGTKRYLSFGGLGNNKNTPQAKDKEN